MARPEKLDIEETLRLLIKTIMGNTLPVFWLFACQPALGVRFDGIVFWSIYATFSIVVAFGMWYINRATPDPTYTTTCEVPTPVFGAIAATFQPTIFLSVLGVYHLMK